MLKVKHKILMQEKIQGIFQEISSDLMVVFGWSAPKMLSPPPSFLFLFPIV